MVAAAPAKSALSGLRKGLEADWRLWLTHFFSQYLSDPRGELAPMAAYHEEFWDAMWAIQNGRLPILRGSPRDAFFAIWSRGCGKSTSTEMAVSTMIARRARRYCLYISDSQDQADQHVDNIAHMLTSQNFSAIYPEASERKVGTYGPATWRHNRLQTASGFTLDAVGLDKNVRGLKQGDQRPDIIILDDIDNVNDSGLMTDRKMRTISRSIMPAAANDCIVIMVQNLILSDGIMDRLANGRADFLRNAYVSGPHPAITGLQYEGVADGENRGAWRITGGQSTWPARSLEDWNVEFNRMGPAAFLAECQHQLTGVSDRVYPDFSRERHQYIAAKLPAFRAVVGGIDFGGEGRTANETAGLVGGVDENDRIVLLAEFKDNGVNVDQRLMEWMRAQEHRWRGPGSITWAADGTEDMGVRLMKKMGFNMRASRRGGGIPLRELRVRQVAHRFSLDASGIPGLRYLPALRKFEGETIRYHRAKPQFEGDPRQRKIVAYGDHLESCIEYLVDLLDGPQTSVITDQRSRTVHLEM